MRQRSTAKPTSDAEKSLHGSGPATHSWFVAHVLVGPVRMHEAEDAEVRDLPGPLRVVPELGVADAVALRRREEARGAQCAGEVHPLLAVHLRASVRVQRLAMHDAGVERLPQARHQDRHQHEIHDEAHRPHLEEGCPEDDQPPEELRRHSHEERPDIEVAALPPRVDHEALLVHAAPALQAPADEGSGDAIPARGEYHDDAICHVLEMQTVEAAGGQVGAAEQQDDDADANPDEKHVLRAALGLKVAKRQRHCPKPCSQTNEEGREGSEAAVESVELRAGIHGPYQHGAVLEEEANEHHDSEPHVRVEDGWNPKVYPVRVF
mmetsp:Transcript_103611/g.260814  ORF Transcript_103611/g.260814 Transcript_103611/m.260814 type:complete len:322 (-) Transcript_103611:356-1321(-)